MRLTTHQIYDKNDAIMKSVRLSATVRPCIAEIIKQLAHQQQMSVSRWIERTLEKAVDDDDYTYTKEELIATFDKAKENCVTFNTAEEAVEFIKSGKPYGSMGFHDQNEWPRFDKLIREQCAND